MISVSRAVRSYCAARSSQRLMKRSRGPGTCSRSASDRPDAPQSPFTDFSLIQMTTHTSTRTMPAKANPTSVIGSASRSVCHRARRTRMPASSAASLDARAMANSRRLGTSKR